MLTPAQKHLVLGLKLMGCNEAQTAYIGISLYTQEMQIAMMDWMCEHQDASPEQLVDHASKIAEDTPDSMNQASEDAIHEL